MNGQTILGTASTTSPGLVPQPRVPQPSVPQSRTSNGAVRPGMMAPASAAAFAEAGNSSTGWDFLPPELYELAQGCATPGAFWARVAAMFHEAEQHRTVCTRRVPGTAATAEEWEAFYRVLGRPDRPEGYELDDFLPPDAARDMPPDVARKITATLQSDMPYIRSVLHAHGVSQQQAKGIVRDIAQVLGKVMRESSAGAGAMPEAAASTAQDMAQGTGLAQNMAQNVAQNMAQNVNQHAASAQNAAAAVQSLWPQDGVRHLQTARRGAAMLCIGDELDKAGLSAHPLVLRLAHALGEVCSEDRLRATGLAQDTVPGGQEAYQEMLRLVGTDAYRRQEPDVVRRVEALARRVRVPEGS